MKKDISTIILMLIFLIGISVLLYPTISDYINSFSQSRAVANYDQSIALMNQAKYEEMIEEAENYNNQLYQKSNPLMQYKEVLGYEKILSPNDDGMIGYIEIDKIKLRLPIYKGTTESILQVGVGHLEGSSLPIGGKNSHAILTGHRGLPSSTLFTNLDRLEIGDQFSISVLGDILVYEIDQIKVVEPNDTNDLEIIEGGDYVTLVTCTPYGINTHRLLVRGMRVEAGTDLNSIRIVADAKVIDRFLVTPILAIPILLSILIYVLIKYKRKLN